MIDISRPPDNECGVVVPFNTVVNDADDIAVVFVSARVYSRGVQFDFELFHRTATVSLSSWGFGRPQSGGSSAGAHLLGFEWSDGTWSSNMPLRHSGGLHGASGGGSPFHARNGYYLDHLPPAREFTVVTAWPYFDLPAREVTFDGDSVGDAASRVRRLWEPVERSFPSRTPEERAALDAAAVLVMPRTGWFGERFDPTPPEPPRDADGNEMVFEVGSYDGPSDGGFVPLPPPVGWRLADD